VRVHPDWRRHGIGVTLLNWLEARARERHTETLAPRAVIESWIDAPSGTAFAQRHGYMLYRRKISMRRMLNAPIPEPAYPPGFELRRALPEQFRAIFDADTQAFRDHEGFTEPDANAFERWCNRDDFQPDLWQVLWHRDSNVIAAMVLNNVNHALNARFGLKRGYTEDISTQRRFRRMGLARNLIFESLRMFERMGMDHVQLGADAENLTGAVRVYEACGYTHVGEFGAFRKALEDVGI
jgi:mycothiol synthase